MPARTVASDPNPLRIAVHDTVITACGGQKLSVAETFKRNLVSCQSSTEATPVSIYPKHLRAVITTDGKPIHVPWWDL